MQINNNNAYINILFLQYNQIRLIKKKNCSSIVHQWKTWLCVCFYLFSSHAVGCYLRVMPIYFQMSFAINDCTLSLILDFVFHNNWMNVSVSAISHVKYLCNTELVFVDRWWPSRTCVWALVQSCTRLTERLCLPSRWEPFWPSAFTSTTAQEKPYTATTQCSASPPTGDRIRASTGDLHDSCAFEWHLHSSYTANQHQPLLSLSTKLPEASICLCLI